MKKILAIVAAFAVVGFNGFMLMEGGIAKADTVTGTGTADLEWDVFLDVTSEIALTCDITGIDLGDINGMTGGTLTSAQRVCNVETNNASGWNLTAEATSSAAMEHEDGVYEFADWATNGSDITCATDADWFGYAVSTSYPGSGTYGGATQYNGFTTSPVVVASNTLATDSSGIDNGFYFKACSGATNNQPTGRYTAHVIATANTNP